MEARVLVDLDGQYRALRERAGVVDRSQRGKLVVAGTEAADYLQGQLTNDVEALEPGGGCYAALLDRKGHMQGDTRVLRIDDETFLLDLEPEALGAVLRHLAMYKIGREVEVADVSDTHVFFSVIGPGAARLTGVPPLAPENTHAPVTPQPYRAASHVGITITGHASPTASAATNRVSPAPRSAYETVTLTASPRVYTATNRSRVRMVGAS